MAGWRASLFSYNHRTMSMVDYKLAKATKNCSIPFFFAILSWTLLLIVMIYPQRKLGFFDLSSHLLQAALFAVTIISWALVFRGRTLTHSHGRNTIGTI